MEHWYINEGLKTVWCRRAPSWRCPQPRAASLISGQAPLELCMLSIPVWLRCWRFTVAEGTSCSRVAATICPRPSPPQGGRADGNVAAVSHGQHVLTPTAAAAWRANTAVSKAAWWPWPFDLESGVRVTCDVGYLCANFGLPGPICYRLRPDVRDRQTDSIIA